MTIESPTYLEAINASASPEVQINQNSKSLDAATVFAKRSNTSNALTFGYWGGVFNGSVVAGGTLTLVGAGSPSTENYVVVHRGTGAISVTQATTNWNNTAQYARAHKITCGASVIQAHEDHRFSRYGVCMPKEDMLWNQQTDNYTLAITDADNGVAMSHATSKNVTIPLNATVAFKVGTSILIYQEGVGTPTIVATGGVTLRVRAAGSPFGNALAGQYALASITQRATDEWILTGDIA